MPELLRQLETLTEPVTSPSGGWALRYDAEGRAVIGGPDGTHTWAAGAVGQLRLELSGVFVVYDGGQVVWRGEVPVPGYTSLHVTDEGDAVIYDNGLPLYSVHGGPIEPVSLGDRAPVAEIGGNRILVSANGRRSVTRTPGTGDGLVYRQQYGLGAAGVFVVQPDEVRTLEQPDTWLTWRFLEDRGRGSWELALVGPEDELRWVHGRGHVTTPPEPELADGPTAEAGDSSRSWLETGLDLEDAYCVTVIKDVDPDEALRRFGAGDDQLSTSTWAQLLRRAGYEDVGVEHHVVAAFGLGPHTLLVEDNGWEGARRPDLSRGTFAVSSYCSVNADQTFLVSRDGETLASFDDNCPSYARGTDPDVLTGALTAMGIEDLEAFDEDYDSDLDDLELLCRVADVRPTIADVTGPGRVAILPKRFPPVRAEA